MLEGRLRRSSHRDHERVVSQRLPALRDDRPSRVVHPRKTTDDQPRAQLVGDVPQPVALSMPTSERLRDRHRPIDELALRRQQRDLDSITQQVAKRQHGLETSHTASGDQDAKS